MKGTPSEVEKDALRFRKLLDLIGYPQNGSHTTVRLFWDDATMTAFMLNGVGRNARTRYNVAGFRALIDSVEIPINDRISS